MPLVHTHAHCTRAEAHRQTGLQVGPLSDVLSLGQVHIQVGAHIHTSQGQGSLKGSCALIWFVYGVCYFSALPDLSFDFIPS